VPFNDEVVVITGAGGGMGREAALAFQREGAMLALMDVSSERLLETVSCLPDPNVFHDTVDIRDVKAIRSFMHRVREEVGPIRALANYTGVWHEAAYDQVTEEIWQYVIDINLKGCFFVCQEAMKQMKAHGGGSIVNIASTAGEYGSIRAAAHYAASKGGIIAMSKSLAREGSPNVRVNVISPGPTDTPMLASTEEEKLEIAKRPLVGRLGTAHDMAEAMLYLSDSRRSGYVTGEVLRVNGGSLI